MQTLYSPRYRHYQKRVLGCRQQHRHQAECFLWFEVTERIGTGLALYYRWKANGQSGYALMHVSSGHYMTDLLMDTPVQAARWLRLVASLCDWKQPVKRLRKRKDIEQAVQAAHRLALLMDAICKAS